MPALGQESSIVSDGEPCYSLAAHFTQNVACIQCPLRRFLVLEVSKHVAARSNVLTDAINHRTALFPGITWLAEAIAGEGRGRNIGRGHGFSLSHTQGDVTRLEHLPCRIGEP